MTVKRKAAVRPTLVSIAVRPRAAVRDGVPRTGRSRRREGIALRFSSSLNGSLSVQKPLVGVPATDVDDGLPKRCDEDSIAVRQRQAGADPSIRSFIRAERSCARRAGLR